MRRRISEFLLPLWERVRERENKKNHPLLNPLPSRERRHT